MRKEQATTVSHSKITKRNFSLYLEKWNPSAKKYINVCRICGHKGYSPVIEQDGFCCDRRNAAIYTELTKTLRVMALDHLGRCESCASVQETILSKKK